MLDSGIYLCSRADDQRCDSLPSVCFLESGWRIRRLGPDPALVTLWSITIDSAALYERISMRTYNRDDNIAAMTAYFRSLKPSPIYGRLTYAADLKKFAADLMEIPVDGAFAERLIESYVIASVSTAQMSEFVRWLRSIATFKDLNEQIVIVV